MQAQAHMDKTQATVMSPVFAYAYASVTEVLSERLHVRRGGIRLSVAQGLSVVSNPASGVRTLLYR